MTGRVAVVTGAASGIGLGIARQLASDGHAVALLDLDGDAAQSAAADLSAQGCSVVAHGADVADRGALERAFSAVREELGPVTIAVTSAGIEAFDSVLEVTPEKWDRVLAVNLTGTFACIQLAVPDMLAAGWGRIVTISSSSAQSGAPNMTHYVASKGGVIGLRWLARPKPLVTSRASTPWGEWSLSAGRALRRTSPPPAPSCVPRTRATSPAR